MPHVAPASHVPPADEEERAATRAVAAVALRQHGRIATAQLADLGVGRNVVTRLVTAGWLVRERRGAYRLAGAPDGALGRAVSAILAVDVGACVSHRSGLELHGVVAPTGGLMHLTTARHHRSRHGIVAHQASLGPDEVVRIEGVRVTSLARCLVDTAATEDVALVERAVREAEFQRVLDADALIATAAGRPRATLLRRLAAERLPVRGDLREEFERRFARFLLDRGFPVADVNRRVRLRRPDQLVVLDVVWWDAGLAVELDSRKAHETTHAFEADRERDRRLTVQHGLTVVRVTWRQLHDDPERLADDLRVLLSRRAAA